MQAHCQSSPFTARRRTFRIILTSSEPLSITDVGSRAAGPRKPLIFLDLSLRLSFESPRTLQRFFAAADTAKLRITHKERNQWGCDGYRCVEYALVSEAFLREANGAVMCGTGTSSVEQAA